ncbi:hypothetical protein ACIPPS_19240 [Streptomyces sp. NPDC090127]|uniref:hypothetical protein n=1 Tax=Streptomyces sp. NPDC090127 TaxID=3365953 RepID=UPI0038216FBB
MRKLATVAMAAGLFLGGMGVAVADAWHYPERLETTGAWLSDWSYTWEPRGRNHGGFHFKGDLIDRNHRDGHNVYVQARVEGYSWNRFNGVQMKTVRLDKIVYDGAAQYTSTADIRVCRDRGSLRPDNCSFTKPFKRR